ncbi:MAG: hypothetical protein WDM90_10980 [Ferruginibacter sp.]
MALLGGALIVAASFLKESGDAVNKKWVNMFVFIGTVLVATFFICGGYAHFKYDDFVDTLIPKLYSCFTAFGQTFVAFAYLLAELVYWFPLYKNGRHNFQALW